MMVIVVPLCSVSSGLGGPSLCPSTRGLRVTGSLSRETGGGQSMAGSVARGGGGGGGQIV